MCLPNGQIMKSKEKNLFKIKQEKKILTIK